MIEESNNNYCVYVHTCPNGKVYYGVTCNIKNRWQQSHYKQTSLEPYIDRYGWKNITHEVLFENLTRDEALKIEDELICKAREDGTCVNANRSGHYCQTEEYNEECNARSKAWYEANKEECNARSKAWNKAHPEEKKAYDKAYYEANKEECDARNKAWCKTNPEKRKAIDKAYREAHPEKEKARHKAYYEANKDKINARRRERRKRKKGGGDKPEPLF